MHSRHQHRHAGPHHRHEFGRGPGFGGPGFGGPRGPGSGRGRGPRARRGDVRAAVLALLVERPMHGYEMIKEIEERAQGAWTPSAGSIYPTLQLLEDEGLVRSEEADGKRRFALTDSGTAEQKEKAGKESPWDAVRSGVAPEAFALQTSLRKFIHAVRQVFDADAEQQKQVAELLDETRRKVYAVLAEDK